jgi:hypothetical protein
MGPEEIQRLPVRSVGRRIIDAARMVAKAQSIPKDETRKIELANGPESTVANPADLEQQVAKLEYELAWVREELVLRENENCSLQTSFNLLESENSQLSRHLSERDAAIAYARSQLQLIMAVLREIRAERNKLAAALDIPIEKLQNDRTSLNIRLGAIPAPTTEKLAAEVCEVLLARAEEGNAAEREVGDETVNAANIKLQLRQTPLLAKGCQVQRPEKSRSKPIKNSTAMLLAHTITF